MRLNHVPPSACGMVAYREQGGRCDGVTGVEFEAWVNRLNGALRTLVK